MSPDSKITSNKSSRMPRRSEAEPGIYPEGMHFVYILESGDGQHWYVGKTNHIGRRIAEHTAGKSRHTRKYFDWRCTTYIAFADEKRASQFEKYLKSHSGRAFAKKRL